MGVSYSAASIILNGATGKSQYATLASTSYIGLFLSEPINEGQQVNYTEVPRVVIDQPSGTSIDTGYARMLIGNYQTAGSQKMGTMDVETRIMRNVETIFFNEAERDWGTVTHFGIFNGATGGNPIFWGALTTPTEVNQGYVAIFKKDQLSMQLV